MSSVGVVVPCYRYGALLQQSVGSVLEQTGVDIKVLIIDDASPDDSAECAKALAATDNRIEVRVHQQNAGHIATYNEGLLDWCCTDYVVLLSADDQLTAGSLSRSAALLDAHPEVGFVYGHYLRFDGEAKLPRARQHVRGSTIWSGEEWLERRFRAGNGCIASPEVMVRTSIQKQVGGYDPDLPHTGDIEMWMRLAAHADVGYLKGVDQAYYRVHAGSMSRGFLHDAGLGDLRQRLAAYEAVLERCGHLLSRRAELESEVRRTLARDALRRAMRAYDRRRTATTPIDELVGFALSCYPEATKLPEYRGLAVRQRIGPKVMPYLQPLVVSAVTHKVRNKVGWERWRRYGI